MGECATLVFGSISHNITESVNNDDTQTLFEYGMMCYLTLLSLIELHFVDILHKQILQYLFIILASKRRSEQNSAIMLCIYLLAI